MVHTFSGLIYRYQDYYFVNTHSFQYIYELVFLPKPTYCTNMIRYHLLYSNNGLKNVGKHHHQYTTNVLYIRYCTQSLPCQFQSYI